LVLPQALWLVLPQVALVDNRGKGAAGTGTLGERRPDLVSRSVTIAFDHHLIDTCSERKIKVSIKSIHTPTPFI